MIPRRSILSVPAHKINMHHKAAKSNADVVMLDLEDSVPIDAKELARSNATKSLEQIDWGGKCISVRMNSLDTPFAYKDILDIVRAETACLKSLVIPKVGNIDDIHFVARFLDGIEMDKQINVPIKIEASIETAKGMTNINSIAKSSNRLISLVFGIADYTASVGARLVTLSGHGDDDNSVYPGHRWHFALSRIVMAAKANNLLAIDAPYGNFKDNKGLTKSASMARALGCDGKWAIHPDQLSCINDCFSPMPEDIEKAKLIISACQNSNLNGVVAINCHMIDQATVRLAQQTWEMADNLGMIEK
jgi:citrate lyase beta subunit